jgi:hypothetical protein
MMQVSSGKQITGYRLRLGALVARFAVPFYLE